MKIQCRCGERIPDQADNLSYKAHIIRDKNYFDFLDTVDAAIESAETNKEKLCMSVRRAEPSRQAWECYICGRIYFDASDGSLLEYIPENGKYNRAFDRD